MINMYRRFCAIIIPFLCIAFSSCIEGYNPDVSDYENLLVVDGLLTDQPVDHFVYLSRSYPYDENSGGDPVSGAVVIIQDDAGGIVYLDEADPGSYMLKDGKLEIRPGREYQLIIEIPGGGHYESGYEVLKSPGSLDSVYYEIKEGEPEITGYAEDGIQIYFDAKGEVGSGGYYQWTFEENWEYTVPYATGAKFRCWEGTNSSNIHILSSRGFEGDLMQRQKLQFISFSNYKLNINYTILVKQYGLNGSTFEFYNALETLMEEPRTVFGQIPYSLYGNIDNVDDPDEPVLGFFQVSGVQEKRIFIERSDLPDKIRIATGNEGCIASDAPDYSISFTWYRIIQPGGVVFWANRLDCTDCTRTGSNVRPAFWSMIDGG